MFWVVGIVVAAAVCVLGGALCGAPLRSSGVWWSLRAGGAGRPSAVALVPVRSMAGLCDSGCRAEEVWRS